MVAAYLIKFSEDSFAGPSFYCDSLRTSMVKKPSSFSMLLKITKIAVSFVNA